MATNADEEAADDSQEVTEETLREAKYGKDGVEAKADETDKAKATEESEETSEEDGQTDDQATDETEETQEESAEESPAFVKEFPYIKGDTPEEYAKNLEAAYRNSTTEAMKWKGLAEEKLTDERIGDNEEPDVSNPLTLYAKQKMDEEINQAFTEFSKQYPQVTDPAEYNKFTVEVATLSNTILNSQKRLAPPKELYSKAAVILGWKADEVDGKEKLGAALKDSAAASKTTSATKPKPAQSKVTDTEVALAREMWGQGKTDAEIRSELEKYK